MRSLILIIAAVLGLLALSSVFTVTETETALKLRLGRIERIDFEPGLYFRIPLIENVEKFDARIQQLDTQPERFLTSEKKNLDVDFYVNWRISDVGKFYTATGGGSMLVAQQRLAEIAKKGLKDQFSLRTIREAVSGERAQIMEILTRDGNEQTQKLGIEIVDVRIKQIDLPPAVSDSVYERIKAERQRVAADFRARGHEAKERIQADADRQVTVLLAEAERDALELRGEGDAKAAEIYAEAFGRNTDFFAFYRSLSAYRTALSGKDDVLVITPDSAFFRFFKSISGGAPAQ